MEQDPVIDRWQRMPHDQFDQIRRDEIRVDLLQAFDAETRRRKLCIALLKEWQPLSFDAFSTLDTSVMDEEMRRCYKDEADRRAAIHSNEKSESDLCNFHLDWASTLLIGLVMLAAGVSIFIYTLYIRPMLGFRAEGGDSFPGLALFLIVGGALTLPRVLVRVCNRMTLQVSVAGVLLLRRNETVLQVSASDMNNRTWGFREGNVGRDSLNDHASFIGMVADWVSKRGPYITDGTSRIYLRPFGSFRVLSALRTHLPGKTPHSFLFVVVPTRQVKHARIQRHVLFPGIKYYLRCSDGTSEMTESPEADLIIEVPHDDDLLFSAKREDIITHPTNIKANIPFNAQEDRVEAKGVHIIIKSCA
jgi:hypothetical protein